MKRQVDMVERWLPTVCRLLAIAVAALAYALATVDRAHDHGKTEPDLSGWRAASEWEKIANDCEKRPIARYKRIDGESCSTADPFVMYNDTTGVTTYCLDRKSTEPRMFREGEYIYAPWYESVAIAGIGSGAP